MKKCSFVLLDLSCLTFQASCYFAHHLNYIILGLIPYESKTYTAILSRKLCSTQYIAPLLFLFISCILSPASAQRKLTRAESFFGFHFDFHATEKDKELGRRFDTDILEDFLKRTRPDFIQIDSKGHLGYSSYPTKCG